jgi:hypothetical protein
VHWPLPCGARAVAMNPLRGQKPQDIHTSSRRTGTDRLNGRLGDSLQFPPHPRRIFGLQVLLGPNRHPHIVEENGDRPLEWPARRFIAISTSSSSHIWAPDLVGPKSPSLREILRESYRCRCCSLVSLFLEKKRKCRRRESLYPGLMDARQHLQ